MFYHVKTSHKNKLKKDLSDFFSIGLKSIIITSILILFQIIPCKLHPENTIQQSVILKALKIHFNHKNSLRIQVNKSFLK